MYQDDNNNYYYSYRNERRGENRWLQTWNSWSMTTKLIAINVAVYVLVNVLGIYVIMEFGCLVPNFSFVYNPWRLITHQFLHANFGHILGNMYALWLFGRLAENALGSRRFLFLYLTSGLIGAASWLLVNYGTISYLIGASGACFGVMTAAAIAYPQAQFRLFFPPIPVRLWVLVAIYCGFEFVQLGGMDNIAHMAHLGGALGGLIFMRRLGFRQ